MFSCIPMVGWIDCCGLFQTIYNVMWLPSQNFASNRLLCFVFSCPWKFHYYILCLFAKGQTKNLKGLRSKNKKLEGFAKQKQYAIFAMRHASQLVVHHPSLIYNVPLIIASLLQHIRQTKLCDPLSLRPP